MILITNINITNQPILGSIKVKQNVEKTTLDCKYIRMKTVFVANWTNYTWESKVFDSSVLSYIAIETIDWIYYMLMLQKSCLHMFQFKKLIKAKIYHTNMYISCLYFKNNPSKIQNVFKYPKLLIHT